MLVWEMAKVFGEECNAKDWILHYEVSKIDRFMFVNDEIQLYLFTPTNMICI